MEGEMHLIRTSLTSSIQSSC